MRGGWGSEGGGHESRTGRETLVSHFVGHAVMQK